MEGSGENAVPDEVAHAERRQFFIQFEANVEALAHRLVYLMYGAVAGSPNLQSMTFETMRRAPKSFHKLIAIAIFNSMVHVARLVCPIAGGLVHEAFQIAYRALSEAEGVNRQGGLGSRAIQAMLSLGVLAILTPSILRDLGFPARLEPGALDGTWAGSWQKNYGQTVDFHHLCLYLANVGKFYKGPDPRYFAPRASEASDAPDESLPLAPRASEATDAPEESLLLAPQ